MGYMTVTPKAKPPAPYIGGKRVLANTIIKQIEAIDHRTYVEPFVGMGGVFLRRSQRPRGEVINDRSREVSTFFRIIQRHYVPFMEMMRFQITTRAEFERLTRTNPETLTDLERAARFLYLQRLAFGGQVKGVFGVVTERSPRFSLSRIEPLLDAAHEFLEGVVFENLDWRDVLTRYDSPGSLFYLDPPYMGGETDYGENMFAAGRKQFEDQIVNRQHGRHVA